VSDTLRKKKPSSVNSTPQVKDFISKLEKGSYLDRIITNAKETLEENMFAGKNIEKKKIPKYYIEKYDLYVLYVMNLDASRRLTYTLVSDGVGVSVNILEIFLDHKEYEKRFGYR